MMEGMESKSILGVRIDNFNNNFEDILERLKNKENALIVTLDIHQLLRVRSNKKLRETVNNASLVIASHHTIAKGYNFIHKEKLEYMKDFIFFSNILSYMDKKKMSMFLFGNEEKYFFSILEKIKKIYPNITNIGSFENTKNKTELEKAFIGLKKIDPNMFLIYMPFKKSLYWFSDNKENLKVKLCVPVSRPLDGFAGKTESPNRNILESNKEEIFYLKKNIFRIFLYFDYIFFWILVLFEKLTLKKNNK